MRNPSRGCAANRVRRGLCTSTLPSRGTALTTRCGVCCAPLTGSSYCAWVQTMTEDGDTVWCGQCGVMLNPDEWLVDHQDMDLFGWVEWCAQHRKEGLA